MPLALAKQGDVLRVVKVSGDNGVCRHLENLGITSGAEITLLSFDKGNMIVRVRDSRLALDRNVARSIIVHPAA